MKRTTLLLLFVSVLMMAGAQNKTYSVGALNKKFNYAEASNMIILGQQDGLTIGVTNRYAGVLKNYFKKELKVVAIDENTNIVRSIEIPETKDCYIQTATYYDGKVYILASHREKHSTYYDRYVVDATTMQTIGEKKNIYTYTSERKDDSYQWVSQSPNGTLAALVHITTNRKSDKFEAVEILLDEEMNIEWQRDYPIYALSNMMVTDDGEIITLGYSGQKAGTKSRISISVISESNAYDLREETTVTIWDIRLAGYKNGKILGMGLGLNASDKNEINYFGISADIKSQAINIGYQSLTDNDKCVYNNIDYGKRARNVNIDALRLRHCQLTGTGAVATLTNSWIVETCNQNGGCSIKSYCEGIIIFGIDDNGNIIWHHGIRKSMKQNGYPTMMSEAVCVEGNDVYLIQSESPKWPTSYSVSKRVKTQKMNTGTKVLAKYHINADGEIEKSVEAIEKSASFDSNTYKTDSKHIGFLLNSSGASIVNIRP